MPLTNLEQSILVDLLIYGDDKANNIADRIGAHRNSVSSRLTELRESGMVRRKGEGTHELTDEGTDFARGYVRATLDIYDND